MNAVPKPQKTTPPSEPYFYGWTHTSAHIGMIVGATGRLSILLQPNFCVYRKYHNFLVKHIKLPMYPTVALTVFNSHIRQPFTAWQTDFILSLQVLDCLSMSLMAFSPNWPGGWSRLPPTAAARPPKGGSLDQPPGKFGEKSIKLIERQSSTWRDIIKLVCQAVKGCRICELKTVRATVGYIGSFMCFTKKLWYLR